MKKNGCPGFLYDEGNVKANKMNNVFIGYWLEWCSQSLALLNNK